MNIDADKIESLLRAWDNFRTAAVVILGAYAKQLQEAFEPLIAYAEQIRRAILYRRLLNYGLPPRLCAWLSSRWPERWLPQLDWDKLKGEGNDQE